jgi:hypothetical protein
MGLLTNHLNRQHQEKMAQVSAYRELVANPDAAPESKQYAFDQIIKLTGTKKFMADGNPLAGMFKSLLGIGGKQEATPEAPPERTVQTGTQQVPDEARPEKKYSLPPVPGLEALGNQEVTLPGATKELPTYGTTRDMFMSTDEQIRNRVKLKSAETTAEETAKEPFRIRDDERRARAAAALHAQDMEGRKEIEVAQALAIQQRQQHDLVVHKEGGAPWEYVKKRINGLGEIVAEEPTDPPDHIRNDFQSAQSMAKRWNVPVTEAYERIVGMRIEGQEQQIKNLKGTEAERAQRMGLRAQLERLRNDLATGGIRNATGARLALNQIRQEVSARRRDKDDPLSEMPFEQAFQYVAAEYGAAPEQVEYLRKLSTGQSVQKPAGAAVTPPVPGVTPTPAAAAATHGGTRVGAQRALTAADVQRLQARGVTGFKVGQTVTFDGQGWK